MARKIPRSLIDLFDLVPLISKMGPKEARVKVLGKLDHSDRMEAKLYRAIREAKSANEGEIAATIGLSPEDKKYGEIKSHLRQMLLDHLFFLDPETANLSKYSQKKYKARRLRDQSLIVEDFVGARVASELAELALPDAIEIEEWSVSLDLLSVLRNGAALSGDQKELKRLTDEYWRIFPLFQAEQEANNVQERITVVFARSGAEHPELAPEIVPAIKKLEEIARKHETFKIQELLIDLKRKLLQVEMDYTEALIVADQGIELLKKYPQFSNNARKSRYGQAKFVSLLQMGRTEDAAKLYEELTTLHVPESDNWYYFQSWCFIMLMHQEKFEDARNLCISIMQSKRFDAQTEPHKEGWQLFLLWADFFSGHLIPGMKRQLGEKPGDISRGYAKLFPSFKGDYAGYRMSAIVLEIIVLLSRKSGRSDIDERIESLKVFKSRHLKSNENRQSNLFIEMVQLLPNNDYKTDIIGKKAAPMLKKMLSIKTIDKMQGQQVMDYEWTWSKIYYYLTLYSK